MLNLSARDREMHPGKCIRARCESEDGPPPQNASRASRHPNFCPETGLSYRNPRRIEVAGVSVPNQPVLDGISLLPLIEGRMKERTAPLGFMLWEKKRGGFESADFNQDTQGVWIDGKFKLVVEPAGKNVRLHDIYADPAHTTNLAQKHPETVSRMTEALRAWRNSVRAGFDDKDYATH